MGYRYNLYSDGQRVNVPHGGHRCYGRYVVAWDVFNSLDAENSLSVLKNAIARHGKPEIINSDQGSQFTCELWTQYVEKEAKITISMDGTDLYKGLDKFFEHITMPGPSGN